MKKTFFAVLFSLGINLAFLPSVSAELPARPIRLVVPVAAGGGTDIVARILAPALSQHWNRQVLVDNRPGASGLLGADIVARSAPTGATLLLASSTLATGSAASPSPGLNIIKALTAVSLVAHQPSVILVSPQLPAQDLKELVALLKSQPGVLNFGSAGVGTASHMANELFLLKTQTRALHVPYKSAGQAASGFFNNEIQFMVTNLATSQTLLANNRARALAVTSSSRISSLGSVPTAREAGAGNFEYSTWYGMFAPAGVKKSTLDAISADVIAVATRDQTRKTLETQGLSVLATSSQVLDKRLTSELSTWRLIQKNLSIK
jgi:tripartite-type tricarboxylate transporter receptor subunit TctC